MKSVLRKYGICQRHSKVKKFNNPAKASQVNYVFDVVHYVFETNETKRGKKGKAHFVEPILNFANADREQNN